jgi:hypothetical protein
MKLPLLLLTLAGSFALSAKPALADDSALPGAGFSAARYEALWTKSPFAVATADAVEDSPDYSLVGIAECNGISYASLIEKENQEHFLISSQKDKPVRGLVLLTITRGENGGDTYANVQKDGQTITLKLEQVAVAEQAPGAPPVIAMPGTMIQQIPMPGAGTSPFGMGANRPFRFRRPAIHLPGQPGVQPQAAQTPAGTVPTPPPPPPQPAP